jgi:hypothetical protein
MKLTSIDVDKLSDGDRQVLIAADTDAKVERRAAAILCLSIALLAAWATIEFVPALNVARTSSFLVGGLLGLVIRASMRERAAWIRIVGQLDASKRDGRASD